jgi:hypothetical protein
MNVLPREGQHQRETLVDDIIEALNKAFIVESGRIHFYEPQLVETIKETLDTFIEIQKSIKN